MIIDYIYNFECKEFTRDISVEKEIKHLINPLFFDTSEFHNYHSKFSERSFRLILKSKEKIIGYCYVGIRDNKLLIPYSAPFSLAYFKPNYRVDDIRKFIIALKDFGKYLECEFIYFTVPPEIYYKQLGNLITGILFSEGFNIKYIDTNNYMDLNIFNDKEDLLSKVSHKTRKNYKKAITNELNFKELETLFFDKAYNVISINRHILGYPLKISKEQMSDLINIEPLKIKFFVVQKEEQDIAAAIIFDITSDVSQVIYWGDDPEYRNERAMEFLALNIFEEYKKIGKTYLDIGPSSENGIVNNGLFEFKTSLGCYCNNKLTFMYKVN